MDQQLGELRQAIRRASRTGRRRLYGSGLRAAVAGYARSARDRGQSLVQTSRELGIPLSTLRLWLGNSLEPAAVGSPLAGGEHRGVAVGRFGQWSSGALSLKGRQFGPLVVSSLRREGTASRG